MTETITRGLLVIDNTYYNIKKILKVEKQVDINDNTIITGAIVTFIDASTITILPNTFNQLINYMINNV
jgi:hypothetical protein